MVLLVSAGLLALSSLSFATVPDPEDTYLVFCQFWAEEVCHKYSSSICRNDPNHLNNTIHGIWPDSYSGTNPGYCTNRQLQEYDLVGIESQMDKQWISYKGGNFQFWQHEWSRHGTCYGLVKNPNEFFRLALKWQSQFDIAAILRRNGIQSGAEYSQDQINDILARDTWGKKPHLVCDGKHVWEMEWCFDYFQNPIDCTKGNSCGSTLIFS